MYVGVYVCMYLCMYVYVRYMDKCMMYIKLDIVTYQDNETVLRPGLSFKIKELLYLCYQQAEVYTKSLMH